MTMRVSGPFLSLIAQTSNTKTSQVSGEEANDIEPDVESPSKEVGQLSSATR